MKLVVEAHVDVYVGTGPKRDVQWPFRVLHNKCELNHNMAEHGREEDAKRLNSVRRGSEQGID